MTLTILCIKGQIFLLDHSQIICILQLHFIFTKHAGQYDHQFLLKHVELKVGLVIFGEASIAS